MLNRLTLSHPSGKKVTIMMNFMGQAFAASTPVTGSIDPSIKPESVTEVIRTWATTTAKSASESTMDPLTVTDAKTSEKLQVLFNQITSMQQGPSLAAYRAFLLASAKNKEPTERGESITSISTTFCKDPLTTKPKITETPGYATLQSLYSDGNEFESEQRRQMGAMEWAKDSTDKNLVARSFQEDTGYTLIGGTPSTLRDYKFTPILTEGTACNIITKVDGVKLLVETHQRLRKRYDAHLNWVYWFLSKIVTIDLLAEDSSFTLSFNKRFMSPEKPGVTVQQELERYISAARRQLLKHYADVERIYTGTIRTIERATSHGSGAATAATASTGFATATAATAATAASPVTAAVPE